MCEPPALFNSGDREPKDAPANAPGPPALKVVLFGATGNVGRRMASEALNRGYEVVGVVRDPAQSQSPDLLLTLVQGDATDAESVSRVARGADVVVQRNRHPVGSSTTLVGDPLGSFGELLEGPPHAIRGSYYAEVAPKRVTTKQKEAKPGNQGTLIVGGSRARKVKLDCLAARTSTIYVDVPAGLLTSP